MEQNLSLYEDALHFYLIISSDDGELSANMRFAREVRITYHTNYVKYTVLILLFTIRWYQINIENKV